MSSQLIKQYIRHSLYRINGFKINVRCLAQLSTENQETVKKNTNVKDESIPESKYAGYNIIYKNPFINYITAFNKVKRNILIGNIVFIPAMYALKEMNIVQQEHAVMIAAFAISAATSLHITGLLCDNQIGIIYYKDNDHIKIAYVNMWGKRIDIDTSIRNIRPQESNAPTIMDKIYKTIDIKTYRHSLKLIVNNSQIFDKERLTSILGDYE